MRLSGIRPSHVALILAMLLAPALYAGQTNPLAALDGELLTNKTGLPMLKINGHEEALSANTPYLLHTLEDKRLEGRQVHLEGVSKPDGTFEVHWLYTVHDGKLYSVRYYCPRCNIVALEPGNCVCCQQPTELQEIPKPANSH